MVKYIWDGRSIFASTSTLLIICTGPLTTASFSRYRFADIFWYDCFYQVSVICCNNTSFPNKIAYQSNQAENLLSTTSNIVDNLAPRYQIKTVNTHDLKGLTGFKNPARMWELHTKCSNNLMAGLQWDANYCSCKKTCERDCRCTYRLGVVEDRRQYLKQVQEYAQDHLKYLCTQACRGCKSMA